MGNPTAPSKSLDLFSLVISSLLVLFSCFNDSNATVHRNLMAAKSHDFYTIKVSFMLPDSICDSSSQGQNLPSSSLKVIHRYGPCHKQRKTDSPPSPSQILTHDEARVESINVRIRRINSVGTTFTATESVTLPAKSGLLLGIGNYIVTVGLGSPKKDLSLSFDTGSSLTWTQCEPCVGFCYKQHDPIFNPSESTSYANVSCDTATCNQLKPRGCTGTATCLYEIGYGDNSSTVGYLGKDTLTLSPTEIVTDFYFGCGQENRGLFGQVDGLFGLGRDPFSFVSQTSAKYGEIFSYCLPSRSSESGYLTLGKSEISNAMQYIPLGNSEEFYFIDITAIYVGGQKLAISPTVFSTYGSIIDSGTVITRFPLEAYTALRNTFRQQMSMYPTVNSSGLFDTCYDFTRYEVVNYPEISIEFGGNTKIDLDFSGIFYIYSLSRACLAFAVNNGNDDLSILGNVQQRTMQVVYDVAGGKLGFGAKGCA